MVHVLETGLEFIARENPNGKPSVRGYNIINGQLTSSSDGVTFESKNPALLADSLGEFPLSTRDDVHSALAAAHAAFTGWAATPAPTSKLSSSFCTTTVYDLPSSFSCHSSSKPVSTFSYKFTWLICSFHIITNF